MVLSRRNSFTSSRNPRHQSSSTNNNNNNNNNYYPIQQQHYHFWPSAMMSSIAEGTPGRQNDVVAADDASTSTRFSATIPRCRMIVGGDQTSGNAFSDVGGGDCDTTTTLFSNVSSASSPDAAADSPLLRSANRRLSGMTLASSRRPPFRNIANTGGGGGSRQLFQRNNLSQMTRRSLQFFSSNEHRSTMASSRKFGDDGNSPPPMLDDRRFHDYDVDEQKQQVLLFDGNHHFRRTINHDNSRRQSSAFELAPSHQAESIAHQPAIMMSSAMAMRKRRASYDIGNGVCHRTTLPPPPPLSEATFERLNVGAGGGGAAAAPAATHRTRDFVRADVDKCIHLDARALNSLLRLDMLQAADPRTIRALQTEIREPQRRAAVVDLAEMCRRFDADVSVFPLAMAFMDRVLAAQFLPQRNISALGGAALLLASKMKAPRPIAAEQIVHYAATTTASASVDASVGGSISGVGELRDWEMFVLNKLSFNLGTVTAFEFLDQLLVRAPILENLRQSFARTLTAMFKDLQLACLPASRQAAACLLYVANESGKTHLVREAEAAIQRCFDVDAAQCRATYATHIRFALSDLFFDNDTVSPSLLCREERASVPSFVPEAKSLKRSVLTGRLADDKGPLVAAEEVIVETEDEEDENDEAMLAVVDKEEDDDAELEKFIIHNVSDEQQQTDICGLTWSFNSGCVAEEEDNEDEDEEEEEGEEEEERDSGEEDAVLLSAQNGKMPLLMMIAKGNVEATSTALPHPPLHFTVVDAEEDANTRNYTELDASRQKRPLDFHPPPLFSSSRSYQSSASTTSSLPYLYCDESSNNSNSSDGYGSSATSTTAANVCALTANELAGISCRAATANDSGFSSTVSTPEADAAPQQTTTLTTTTTMTTVTCSSSRSNGGNTVGRMMDPLPPPPLSDIPHLLLTDEEVARSGQQTRKQNFYSGTEEFAVFRRHQGFGQLF